MAMLNEWHALKAYIDGFTSTGQMILTAHSGDQNTTGASASLETQADQIQAGIKRFRDTYASELPEDCLSIIDGHLRKGVQKLGSPFPPTARAISVVAPFMELSTELTYLFTDTQRVIQRQSERAFAHLRRQIEASPTSRAEWFQAFQNGETDCEKLGATHLLLHGIFAFKVNAEGARTDLVFPEPVNIAEVSTIADGLVLTEWKRVNSPSESQSLAKQARDQAKLYSASVLAGVELRCYRYIVLVSENQIDVPDDVQNNEIIYRHINIPVQPKTPSKASKISPRSK
jgi:hypothetical protein